MSDEELTINDGKKKNKITRSKKYLLGLFIFLCFMEILDTYSTMIPIAIVSSVQQELFIDGMGMNQTQADVAYARILFIASIGMYFGIFTRLFADITGRKVWLFITALGMGVGSLVVGLSKNTAVYTIGLFILFVFYSSDIWSMFVAEEAPKGKRGIYHNLILVAGLLAGVIGFIVMGIFITDEHQTWRPIAMIGAFGIVLSVFVYFLDETAPFKELEDERKKQGKPRNNPFKNMLKPFRGIYGKRLIPILTVMFLVGFTESIGIMTETLIARYLGHDSTTIAIAISLPWLMIGYVVVGKGMDKFGRKPIKLFFSILGPLAGITYVLGLLYWGWTNVILVGSMRSLLIVSSIGIVLPNKMAGYESVSTDIRGATASWMALIRAIGNSLGLLVSTILIKQIELGWTTLIISCAYLIIIPITLLLGKETKDVDMREV